LHQLEAFQARRTALGRIVVGNTRSFRGNPGALHYDAPRPMRCPVSSTVLAFALLVSHAEAQPTDVKARLPAVLGSQTVTDGTPPGVKDKADGIPPEGDLVALETRPEAELLVAVKLSGNDPYARYEIRSSHSDSVLLTCYGTCAFRIWPGRYRLLTHSSKGRIGGEEWVVIDRDSHLRVSSPTLAEPIVGALIAVVGAAAVAFGAVEFTTSHCSATCSNDTANQNRLGAGFMFSGAIALPVGLTVLNQGLSPTISLTLADFSGGAAAGAGGQAISRGVTWSVAF